MITEIEKRVEQITHEEILTDLQRVAGLLHKSTVSQEDYEKYGNYAFYEVKIKFGNWSQALKTAKLKIHPGREYIDEKKIIQDIKNAVKISNKKIITLKEYEIFGKYDDNTVYEKCGSWNKALIKAGFRIIRIKDISKKDLMENLKALCVKLKRTPTYKDFNLKQSKFSIQPYLIVFGSLNKTLEIAGIKPNKYYKITEKELITNLINVAIKLKRTPLSEE